ncbi:hypothetical protein EV378_6916 [Pseudonocardia endophytica]|uniref:Uncharacterized protein n=1 Tax=Pseudonocardia endophytica TaxID=401976 RepID=A0A4R1HQB7_PSEEN|nr:hypothetical protein EV378_6916 [Pseudonocardia endophytica]
MCLATHRVPAGRPQTAAPVPDVPHPGRRAAPRPRATPVARGPHPHRRGPHRRTGGPHPSHRHAAPRTTHPAPGVPHPVHRRGRGAGPLHAIGPPVAPRAAPPTAGPHPAPACRTPSTAGAAARTGGPHTAPACRTPNRCAGAALLGCCTQSGRPSHPVPHPNRCAAPRLGVSHPSQPVRHAGAGCDRSSAGSPPRTQAAASHRRDRRKWHGSDTIGAVRPVPLIMRVDASPRTKIGGTGTDATPVARSGRSR